MQITMTGKLLDYKDFTRHAMTFVETGSAAGDGIQRALDAGFQEIHSIEAAERWWQICQHRFITYPYIHIYHGKSTDILGQDFLPYDQERIIFFLDAHPSGPLSAGHADVMEKGASSEFSQDNIIKAELTIILEKYKFPLIIIDDQNGLDEYSKGYIDMILEVHPNYVFEFYDENLGGDHFYENKLLVAKPVWDVK